MKKFEYRVLHLLNRFRDVQDNGFDASKLFNEECNKAGENGWEVVTMTNFCDHIIVIFKREFVLDKVNDDRLTIKSLEQAESLKNLDKMTDKLEDVLSGEGKVIDTGFLTALYDNLKAANFGYRMRIHKR